ncbi:unnamed protein product [Prorocentrum cordatum]|uniref:Reverse transcriptase domain-containing protein n=1 Tax=Prorocentrum cordatum TaxID=2364126 RepID=A0ABN9VX06_9DINO|nr:unnamed protein product [Polarella glacialis]
MNASAAQHAESLRYSGRERVESARQEQAELWREALAEVHGKVLMELGFVDLDPGRCWEGRADGLGFARCCSVGDLAARCWGGEAQADADAAAPQSARELELRCCGGMARRGPLDPRLVLAVASQLAGTSQRRPDPQGLVPAVEAWLRNPAGQAEDGTPLSELVLRQVVEEIDEEHPLPPHADEQLWRPVERLRADLDALGAAGDPEPARFAGEEGAGTREAWLPLPPLAGGAGSRRAAYVTVALAPQLAQVAPEDLRPEPGAGSVEEVDLGALAGTLAARRAESAEGAAAEAGVRQLREAEALLRSLHGRTEWLWTCGGREPLELLLCVPAELVCLRDTVLWRVARLRIPEAPRSAECTADGWRELAGGEAEAGVFAGARVRTRRRGSEDITGDEGLVRAVLTLSGEPGVLTRVWQVVDPGTGGLEYFDFSDHAIMVSVPCNVTEVVPPAGARGPAEEGEGGPPDAGRAAEGRRWPLCVEANVALPSSNGTGLFVNLQALGISSGCFQDDCSHSDHFACASPAECARACARIGACRRWTFQERPRASPGQEDLRELAEGMGTLPTFPSQEVPPRGAGKGKGSLRSIARKRHAADAPGEPGSDEPVDMEADDFTSDQYIRQVCREEFEHMRGTITAEVSSSISKTVGENHTTLNMLSAMQAEVAKQAQIDEHTAQLLAAQTRLDRHDSDIDNLREQVAELRKQLALAAAAPRDEQPPPSSFERAEDSTIVVAVAQKPTTQASIAASLQPWLEGLGFSSEDFSIVLRGMAPARRFEVQFKRPSGAAARKARTAISSLRDQSGWKEFWVTPPGAERCRLHLGPDKGPKRIKQDFTHRKVRQAVDLQYPGRRLFSDKERAVLSIGWDKFMQLQVFHGDTPPKLYWDIPVLRKHDMDVETLRAACRDITHPADPSQWTLLQAGGDEARIKKAYLHRLRPCSTVTALKEVHQDHRRLVSFASTVASGISIFTSFDEDPLTGHIRGCAAILVPPLAGSHSAMPTTAQMVLIPGRAHVVTISSPSHSVDVFNIHNHELAHADVRHVVEAIKASRLRAQEAPDMRATFVLGDFNFAVHDALSLALPTAELFASSGGAIQIVLPKNVTDDELRDRACIPFPDKVRVSGLRNCDLKIISAVVNHAARPALQAMAPQCQRGSVPGRNFGVNILELDVSSRILSVTPHASRDTPVLYPLDFGQAFPSLNQDFLTLCHSLMGPPGPLVQFASSIYSSVEGATLHQGHFEHGCPISGTFYALGITAFLVDVTAKIEGPQLGLIRACADDIGGALRSVHALSQAS